MINLLLRTCQSKKNNGSMSVMPAFHKSTIAYFPVEEEKGWLIMGPSLRLIKCTREPGLLHYERPQKELESTFISRHDETFCCHREGMDCTLQVIGCCSRVLRDDSFIARRGGIK
jgi:hypothetical protein